MSARMTLHPYITGAETEIEVNGNTVGSCLADAIKTYPVMQAKLFAKPDKLKGYVEIYVNGKPTVPQELAYPVSDGDEINVLVFLSGG